MYLGQRWELGCILIKTNLDIVDGMNILHGVLHNLPDLLESTVWSKSRHSVSLGQDVACVSSSMAFSVAPLGPIKR